MKYILKKQKGFSLIEMIIYFAIFAMISILVINSFITVMRSFTTTRTNRVLLEAGSNSMERISREIRDADVVDLTNSDLLNGKLYINNTIDGITKRFNKETDGVLNFYDCNSVGVCDTLIGNLIGEDIYVDSLVFRKISTPESEAIKIEMTLRDIKSKVNKTANFYNTITLRGGY